MCGRIACLAVRYLEKENAHVALMIGDLSYALGYAADWDYFGSQVRWFYSTFCIFVG